MSEGKRPGGLTALAVINFIFAGLGVLSTLGMMALIAIFSAVDIPDEAMQEMKTAFDEAGIGMGFFVFVIITSIVVIILEILSGIGYIKQKKFLGRGVGNIFAITSIGSSMLMVVMFPEAAGGGFNIGTIVGLIYPVLTLVLLNTTFKEDFIN